MKNKNKKKNKVKIYLCMKTSFCFDNPFFGVFFQVENANWKASFRITGAVWERESSQLSSTVVFTTAGAYAL